MKKTLILVLAVIITLPLFASHQKQYWFLADTSRNPEPIDITAGATITYPTLNSETIDVSKYSVCSLIIIFGREAGAADTVNIEMWCSPDGDTWSLLREASTPGEPLLQIPTNTDAITGNTVTVTFQVNIHGIKYLRIGSVENSDDANNITDFNVLCSLGTI